MSEELRYTFRANGVRFTSKRLMDCATYVQSALEKGGVLVTAFAIFIDRENEYGAVEIDTNDLDPDLFANGAVDRFTHVIQNAYQKLMSGCGKASAKAINLLHGVYIEDEPVIPMDMRRDLAQPQLDENAPEEDDDVSCPATQELFDDRVDADSIDVDAVVWDASLVVKLDQGKLIVPVKPLDLGGIDIHSKLLGEGACSPEVGQKVISAMLRAYGEPITSPVVTE
jgi:hypothetical protein